MGIAVRHTPRILLICQNMRVYETLVETFSTNFVCTICSRYEDIKKHIADGEFNLILVEHSTNEDDILKILIACEQPAKIDAKVILLNGSPTKEWIAAAFSHGLCDYFPSPVKMGLLLARVQSLLQEKDETDN